MPDRNAKEPARPAVAIACGGTGGHLFPGLAVGQELARRDCAVTLIISSKSVDQQAVRGVTDMEILTLPATGLERGGLLGFASGFWKSYRKAKKHFAARPPQWALAMGGFVSAPPILAAKGFGATTFIHESNTIPGRANRWLARWVDGAFVYFQQTAARLPARRVETAGMPVRSQFLQPLRASQARAALALEENAPVLLVMGGSQGAGKLNEWIIGMLPRLRLAAPELQFIHLTGENDFEKVRAAYAACEARAVVQPFMNEMGLVLAAAEIAVSRAGASSLAELAARQTPAILIPYPAATDDHQYHNARAFADGGAALMMRQCDGGPEALMAAILSLLRDPERRGAMRAALAPWRRERAAADIAERILHWHERRGADPAPADNFKTPTLGALNV